MELLSGDPFNHGGHPWQSPQIRAEAMLPSAVTQRRVYSPQLTGAEPGLAASPARSTQALHTSGFPLLVPTADALPAGLELASYPSLGLPFSEQTSRLLAPLL